MSNFWFSSDLHVNHRSIMRYTPRGEVLGFGPQDEDEQLTREEADRRVAAHNAWILDMINFYIQPQDRFYILGDVFFGDVWHAAYWLSQVKCKHKILVTGNHDEKFEDFYAANKCPELFEEVHFGYGKFKIDGKKFIMSHYPIAEWDSGHHGAIHLHGHTHGNFDYEKADLADKKILDVGWDNSIKVLGEYRPFHMSDVEKYMEGRVNIMHHNKAG